MSDTASYRLFFAVWPDDACRLWLDEQVEALHQRCHGRQVPPRQLHLTLAFVGEVAHAQLPQVEGIGRDAAQAATACHLRLDRLAVWENGIGCALPSRTPRRLANLADALNAALKDASLPHQARRFKPHLTLLRKAEPPSDALAAPEQSVLLPIDHLSLVVSRLTRSGPIYQELRRWPLAPPAQD